MDTSESMTIDEAYEKLCTIIKTFNIEGEISEETFKEGYENGQYESVEDYYKAFVNLLDLEGDRTVDNSGVILVGRYHKVSLQIMGSII